jgi:MFS family permease
MKGFDIKKYQYAYRALKNPNYRLFFAGQSISLIGTWMQRIAVSWLVYRLTGSALLLGAVGFATQIPNFILAPFGGVIADRYNRYRILLVTQVLSLIQASILAALVLLKTVQVWEVFALAFCLGLINALDVPVRQAFVVEMVDNEENLGNAIALNSFMVNIARMLGPTLAGVLIATWGEGVCFLVNAVSFVAVIASLWAMHIKPRTQKKRSQDFLIELREGLGYAYHSLPLRSILCLLALVSLMGMPYQVLMPIFAKQSFGGDSRTLGFLMSMIGIGAICGGIFLAGRRTVYGLVDLLPRAAALFGLGLVGFALSRQVALSALLLVLCGCGMMMNLATSNTILQSLVDEDKRGRIMSLHTVAFLGMAPFGNLISGFLAQRWGAPNTILFGGTCCLVGASVFAWVLPSFRGEIHAAYARKGIVPSEPDVAA